MEIKNIPKAKQGKIDLRSWNFQNNGMINLKGEWGFYWKKFILFDKGSLKPNYIFVPSSWNQKETVSVAPDKFGYASYQLSILLPKKSQSLSLKFDLIRTAYEVYVNGQKLCSCGKVGINSTNSQPFICSKVIPIPLDTNEVEIIIYVSNFHHNRGGIGSNIKVGLTSQIQLVQQQNFVIDLLLTGSLLIMGLYYLDLYFLRKKDNSMLFFGLICLLTSLRTLIKGEVYLIRLIPSVSWETLVKIDYITFYCGILFFTLFHYSLFPKDHSKSFTLSMVALMIPFILIVILTSPYIYTQTLVYYEVISCVVFLFGLYSIVISIFKKCTGSIIFFLGFLSLFFTVLNDFLHDANIIHTGYFSSYGLFTFIFFQSVNLSRRFVKAFSDVELLSIQLKNTNSSLSRFVPEEFLQLLNKNSIVDINLGEQIEKKMTILFSDIRSFTNLSETMSAMENFNFINSYLKRMNPIIKSHNGFIDKYIGDCIMALFPKKPEDALNTAIEMQKEIRIYNYHRSKSNYKPIDVGIGIHTGYLMLGTIGGEERMEGTVISDAVNVASRVEELTKRYKASILISKNSLEDIENLDKYQFRILDRVKVKGKTTTITIYEILDGYTEEKIEKLLSTKSVFELGVNLYINLEIEDAFEIFKEVYKKNEDDFACQLYIKRCEQIERFGIRQNWDEVQSDS